MRSTVSDDDLLATHRELVSRNKVEEGVVYLQMTRGAIDRDFLFDTEKLTPTLVLFTQSRPADRHGGGEERHEDRLDPGSALGPLRHQDGAAALSLSWQDGSKSRGADDAWMVRDGVVTEGTSNNAFIVTKRRHRHKALVAFDSARHHPRCLMAYSEANGTKIEEREFTIEEAREAAEAFITSASVFVGPVISIDGVELSGGKPGPVTLGLRKTYIEESLKRAL
jgi:D-alanine transaminase